MEKLPEVETARKLMNEAVNWSVMMWLREKKRVRRAADQANAALDNQSSSVKERWTKAQNAAYEVLRAQTTAQSQRVANGAPSEDLDEKAKFHLRQIKQADDMARHARMDAEETFAQAEKQLSTRLAREGCRKALLSWELHERATEKAEALLRSGHK